jgi:cytochrome c biogenesis protein CcmG/thiol:disulfide interchange protein DsbE
MRPLAVLIACCALAAALPTGCGSSGSSSETVPTPADARAALRGSPPPLAALHAQASELLPGTTAAFDAQLAALRGHPLVVNVWASWCNPCKQEFPVLQRASVRYGDNVGFLGIATEDVAAHARTWLRQHFVAYPSYDDHSGDLASKVGIRLGIPGTVFYDRDGEVAYLHQGPYKDDAALERDLQRHLGAVPNQ